MPLDHHELDSVRVALRRVRIFRTQEEMDEYAKRLAQLPAGEQAVWSLLGDCRADALDGINLVVEHDRGGVRVLLDALKASLALWPEIPPERVALLNRGEISGGSAITEFSYWKAPENQRVLINASLTFGEEFKRVLLVPADADVARLDAIIPEKTDLGWASPFEILGLARRLAQEFGWAGYEIGSERRQSILLFRPDLQRDCDRIILAFRKQKIASKRVFVGRTPSVEIICAGE